MKGLMMMNTLFFFYSVIS